MSFLLKALGTYGAPLIARGGGYILSKTAPLVARGISSLGSMLGSK